jgi:hypothetical protein
VAKVICKESLACREPDCGGKKPHEYDKNECGHCPKNPDAECFEVKQDFKAWFGENGNELLKGWLRAREDGNEEPFADWVLGEYDYYLDDSGKFKDGYEIPYHGICDSPSKVEVELKL